MKLIMYGAPWCPDVHFAEKALAKLGIPYSPVNIENADAETIACLVGANGGEDWAVPTFYAEGRYFACGTANDKTIQEMLDFYRLK